MPLMKKQAEFDPAAVASRLPEKLQRPAGMALGALKSLMPSPNDPVSALTPTPLAVLPGGILRGLLGNGGEAIAPKALSEASHRIAPVAETLGEVSPEFTPVGREALHNIGKTVSSAGHSINDLAEEAYRKYISRLR